MSVLIQNGTCVTSETQFKADILIENGIITEISPTIAPKEGVKIYDATGCYVCPGGLDPHVHIFFESNGAVTADNWRTGTIAAACGGTTTLIEFVPTSKRYNPSNKLLEWLEEGKKAFIDYSMHMQCVNWNDEAKESLELALSKGITSVKVFMAYNGILRFDNDKYLMDFLSWCGQHGVLPMVHAEEGDIVEYMQDLLYSQGHTGPEYHQLSRTYEVEAAAVKRISTMANQLDVPLYVVHNTNHDAVEFLNKWKSQPLFAEVTINHLTLNTDEYTKGGVDHGVQYVLSPPLRPQIEVDKLWEDVKSGKVFTISTDHCPFYKKDKLRGAQDFRKVPNGCPAVEERMTLFWHYGVTQGNISPSEYVRMTSTNAAKIFGMYPKKGELQVGSDGDIVVINPKARRTLTVKDQKCKVDYNNWEGLECVGIPVLTVLRGKILFECKVEDGIAKYGEAYVAEESQGEFIQRKPFVPFVYGRKLK